MKLEVIEKNNDALFNRECVTVKVTDVGATPSRLDVKKKLATQLKVDPKLVQVRKMDHGFGASSLDCEVCVYKDEASLNKAEPSYYVKKNVIPEEVNEVVAEEKVEKAPEAVEEASVEEKAEEAPKEKKEGEQ